MKSPVASLCFDCSSVRKRVRVTMSVLTFSCATGTLSPFVWAIVEYTVRFQGSPPKGWVQMIGKQELARENRDSRRMFHYYLILHWHSSLVRVFVAVLTSSAPPNIPSCLGHLSAMAAGSSAWKPTSVSLAIQTE